MPTFEVDDQFHSHPKADKAGLEALGLWVLAGSWCAGYLTDGHVPRDRALKLGNLSLWTRLVKVGLAEEAPDGYQLHDYLHWNRPASEIAEDRVRAAAKKRDQRAKNRAESKCPQGTRGGASQGTASGQGGGHLRGRPGGVPASHARAFSPAPAPAQKEREISFPAEPSEPAPIPPPVPSAPLPGGDSPSVNSVGKVEVETVFSAYLDGWRRTVGGSREPALDSKRRKLIRARLKDFSVEDLCRAAAGIWQSSWHVENRQTSFELALRDTAHVEKFLETEPAVAASDFEWTEPPEIPTEDPPGTVYVPPPAEFLAALDEFSGKRAPQ